MEATRLAKFEHVDILQTLGMEKLTFTIRD